MRAAREELTVGEWALLGLLDEEPTHGFALARTMATDGEVGQVWAMRRPLVYRALGTLEQRGLIRAVVTRPSQAGPQRTIFEPTPAGREALQEWLDRPVQHVRDARSLLMLKLLLLERQERDASRLLEAQRHQFTAVADRLEHAAKDADGFTHTLMLWRLHNATAAIRFTETLLNDGDA